MSGFTWRKGENSLQNAERRRLRRALYAPSVNLLVAAVKTSGATRN